MAQSSSSRPTVTYRHNPARGRHEIGVKIGGTFVPFATLDDARYAQLEENEKATAGSGNDEEGNGE